MKGTLITAGRVLTGPGGEHVVDAAVLTDGERIVAVGPRDAVTAQARGDEDTVALPDATLLPGLIDCHVHLIFDGGPDPVAGLDADDDALLAAMQVRAGAVLAGGVTTVRDLGCRNHLALRTREALAAAGVPRPRIVAAGSPLTVKGGHCWFLGGEVEGGDGIRELVRANAAAGADVIKVMATGGRLTSGGPPSWQTQFGAHALAVVVDEARRAGLPTAAHAHGTEGIVAAVEAGVHSVEHCSWMSEHGLDLREDVLDDIVAKDIFVCPTISPDWPKASQRFGAQWLDKMSDKIRRMAERGVRLVAGTDMGVQRAGFDEFAGSLGFYRHIGLPNHRIIDMATVEAADALGLADETGRLSAGLRADLIAVNGDPLKDLDALRDLRLVMAGGRVVR